MENLNLWTYLKEKYGVQVTYSDSGWKCVIKGQTSSHGETAVGLMRRNVGMRQDPKLLHKNISEMLMVIYAGMFDEIQTDAVLRTKFSEMKVIARRRARNG